MYRSDELSRLMSIDCYMQGFISVKINTIRMVAEVPLKVWPYDIAHLEASPLAKLWLGLVGAAQKIEF